MWGCWILKRVSSSNGATDSNRLHLRLIEYLRALRRKSEASIFAGVKKKARKGVREEKHIGVGGQLGQERKWKVESGKRGNSRSGNEINK